MLDFLGCTLSGSDSEVGCAGADSEVARSTNSYNSWFLDSVYGCGTCEACDCGTCEVCDCVGCEVCWWIDWEACGSGDPNGLAEVVLVWSCVVEGVALMFT